MPCLPMSDIYLCIFKLLSLQFSDEVMEFGRKLLVAVVHPKGVVSTWNATYPDLSIEARFADLH